MAKKKDDRAKIVKHFRDQAAQDREFRDDMLKYLPGQTGELRMVTIKLIAELDANARKADAQADHYETAPGSWIMIGYED